VVRAAGSWTGSTALFESARPYRKPEVTLNTNALTWQETLYRSVTERLRPEDVAREVVSFFPDAPHISKWRSRANAGRGYARSYMPTDFPEPHPLTKTANVLALLLDQPRLTPDQTLGPEMDRLLELAKREIGADAVLGDRLNREGRGKKGVRMSRRRYSKIYRIISFLEEERAGNRQFGRVCALLRAAKTGLARHLTLEEFGKDRDTALFVAYMCARMNLRSEFIAGPQTKAFDDLAQGLLKKLESSDSTNWYAVAHVFPRADVVGQLTDEQKTRLFAQSLEQMRQAAEVLSDLHEEYDIDYRVSTVVRPGQDSSTWNAAAGAWNKTRDWWITLTHTMGMWETLEDFLPGKALRLIAADIAAWHRSIGSPVHPDELVAKELPAPWEVFLTDNECDRDTVVAACRKHGVDPEKSGWAGPRPRTEVASWTPTPELVHGVTVAMPEVAFVMRKMKWYSGPAKYYKSNKRSTQAAKKQKVAL
jgi:hypothetical protein